MSENTTSPSNSSPDSQSSNSGANASAKFPISMTEKAAAQIKMIQEREDTVHKYLRVSVVGGGCSGLSYKLSFEEAPGEKDRVEEFFGIKMLADPKSLLFLKGTELDFTDGLDGQGFVFQNPNAKQSCGCGSSFSA
ncbi:iron-sulfur cluster assembly accessory protein [bacterium]|nr:iron-sulfur cluster assembly accessory protein [bacterium]